MVGLYYDSAALNAAYDLTRAWSADERQNAVNSISDSDRLRRMTERLLTASTWAEVLATA